MGLSHRKKLTQEQLADFKARYDAGESVTALCLEFNVSRASGFRYINGQTKKEQHRLTKTALYRVWVGMRSRCNNPNHASYKWYGAEGVKVCEKWENSFVAFYEWAIKNGYKAPKKGERNYLSLDRIVPSSGYTPDNCRWTSQHIQTARQRKSARNASGYKGVHYDKRDSVFVATITINGETFNLKRCKTATDAVMARDEFIKNNKLHEYPLQVLRWED